MKILTLLPFSAVVLGTLSMSASARDHDHDHDSWRGRHDSWRGRHDSWRGSDHHWWGGGRTHVSVGIGAYPYGYGYYRPYPYYYESRPSVVYVDRARGSVELDVQRELRRRGYYGGPVDGDIGPQTRAAIRAYQVDRALPVTGRIDTPLLNSLRLL